ncbi:equilibrative nucleoside transporter 3-like, partial [Tropilaelaps mercedesae]
YGFVTFTIFLFGVASLLPWNFFITATDYWNYKFRDPAVRVNSTETTPLQKSFNSYLAIASKLPYILFLVVNTAISNKVRCSVRVGFSLLACTALFLATTILVKVNTDKYQKEFLAATLCIVVLINVVCGFLQGGGTGLAGVLPSRYMAANVMGQATGGIFATLAQLFSLLLDAHPTDAALLYFGIATGLLIMTQMFFGILVKMNFYKYYMGHQNPCKISAETGAQNTSRKTPFWVIFKSGWKFHIAIVAIFWVTLAVFPAITALVRSSHADSGSALTNKFFVPLTCFVIFNFTDLFGRILAKYQPIPSSRGTVVLSVAIARIVFIPLLLLCNVTPASRSVTSVMFPHDWQFILIMTLFGLSNGYVTTLALTYASKACSEAHQEVAGSLAAVFLGVGLALGSLSSYGCIQLL